MAKKTTEFREIPGLKGVSVVRHHGPPPTGARHRHDSLCLGAVLAGERAVTVDGVSHAAGTGEVLVLGPGLVHACEDRGESRYVMVSVAPDWFARLGLEPVATGPPVRDDPDLFARITALADLADGPGSPLERETALLSLLQPLSGGHGDGEGGLPEPERIRTVRERLESGFAQDLSLDALARLAGCSPWRLNRTFSAAVGMPPHEYQSMLRVREVKRLIREGISLTDAALEAGFSDQSHMTRSFRKFMGMTPGTFAKGLGPAGAS
jgi:AraC-like DNA-binding protein